MTWKNPLYLQDPATTYAAVDDRFIIDTLFSEGILNVAAGQGLAVQNPAGANRQVWVPALDAIIDGDDAAGQGAYLARMTVGELLDIAAAPTTNPRIDLIVAEVVDSQYRTISTANPLGSRLRVITGTPAASPAVPALPATAIRIASVAVAVNSATVTTANITDLRTQSGSAGYAPTAPAMTTAQRNAISNPTIGYTIFNTTTGKQEVYGGSTLGWVSGASLNVQTFPASGTWTKPLGAALVLVDAAAGGGGGAGKVPGNNGHYGGAGGAGGARASRTYPAAALPATVPVTVGGGGTGGTGVAGGTSGTSAFGSMLVVGGGTGGTIPTTSPAGQSSTAGVSQNGLGITEERGDSVASGNPQQQAFRGGGAGGSAPASSTSAGNPGQAGSAPSSNPGTAGAGGTLAAPAGVAGSAGANGANGSGGGSGASVVYPGVGGTGGNGGIPGGGGGGGGNGFNDPGTSSKGGDGARGEVTVYTITF